MTNAQIDNIKPVPLAPPSTEELWTLKNPISLILEILIIFQMFFVTLFFKMFRVFLPTSKKSVKGNVVLITGSGRGLGRELALEFAHLGAKVACVDVDQTSNEETIKLIESKVPNVSAKAYTVNVADSSETAALAVKVEIDLGPVDILINNAAVIVGHTFLGAQDHTISTIININLLGHFWMIRSFLPSMMKRNSGHIVAISSISSISGIANFSAYTASKSGINGMMDSLREELREHSHNKIHTTVVIPKLINSSADYMKFFNSRLPVLSVEQVAKATVHGILTNEVEFTIPRITYFANVISKLFPVNISDSIKNIFYLKVMLPPQEYQDNLPNMSIINRTVATK
ncbi:short-chain dehydrogenase/reductase family 16C member 6-like isoform X2 [Melanaphis sacchari]|nr:short-chain dehydrogenase/reductase family 16C member 6-like isoform X2 [Melanaphis sacchari]XP_025195854.1 short-chain dehydrogenase/reductase family 16C member 6-like isoform X2 [Melanaphis sacchari]XP_025195855.1 short-chain dehydrogenase/reductase family 16C member 6-like isoform X2 [Melanaphis sacchari]